MRYVILGNGIAGITAAQHLRRFDAASQITLLTNEPSPAYSRPGIMYYMMGRLKEWDLQVLRPDDYRRLNLTLTYETAVRISPSADTLELASGASLAFDRLLLATGSLPRLISEPGSTLAGLHHMITLTDVKGILRDTRKGMRAVVIGGGLLGAELAEVWRHFGLPVTMLVREPWYFPRGLSEPQGRIVEQAIRLHGCDLFLNEEVANFTGETRVTGVVTKSGKTIPADIVGITVGVEPNLALARDSGLAVNRGVLVDGLLRTSRPNIFAAGDCAEIAVAETRPGMVEQLWYSAMRQGEQAARVMCGDLRPYDAGIFYNSAAFFDRYYLYLGASRSDGDGQQEETIISRNGRAARRFIHRDGLLTGISAVGTRDRPEQVMEMVRAGTNLAVAINTLGGRA